MNKRFISAVLCVMLLLGLALPVYATDTDDQDPVILAEIKISTPEEFLGFAENCRMDSYSRSLLVSLEADIDLSGVDFAGVPIFCGTFKGNGHTISGLRIANDGSDQGLFRYLTATALVEELHVSGDVAPGGSRAGVGGIAGRNEGTVRDCSFDGTVSGGDSVGGLVGVNAVTGIIDGCSASGVIHGNHFVGGIAGENYGVIRSCSNDAQINTTAQQNSVEIADITLDTLTSSESADTVTDIGGITGVSTGVIRDCENRGGVGYQQMGYNIGGIAGTQSGYLTDCRNYGPVQGRKEVGGIVGQLEPAAVIAYSEDTLQILQGQLDTMSGMVSQTSSNAQANASQITGQIGVLQDQVRTAQDSVSALFPDAGDPSLPDADAILAAQNTLTTTLSAMPGTLNNIASAAQSTVTGLTRDLQAVSGQIGAMSQTINGASENLGGTITDISDQDTPELLTGKVASCANYGTVLADMNAGGIVGAMAMENDMDILEDWEQSGEDSLNFESEVRAVVLNCENRAAVTGKKQHVGGIAGWQPLGLVKECVNTGALDGTGADYVGGISGLSTGFIRSNYAKCEIEGSTYVGGIAGSGTIVTDCRSMVCISGGSEKLGAVLGAAEQSSTEEEDPISANFYYCGSGDPGGIDGISYSGDAEPLDRSKFLALESLPDLFRSATVRFRFADGTEQQITVATGEDISDSEVPAIPEEDGRLGTWEGLTEDALTGITFDRTFEAVYSSYHTVIQTAQIRENGLPVLLAQGEFTEQAKVSVTESGEVPALQDGETLLESWTLRLNEASRGTAARFLLPEELDAAQAVLYVCGENGQWTQREFTADESYIVFDLLGGESHIAIAEAAGTDWLPLAAAGGAALTAVLALAVWLRRRKAKTQQHTAQ